jgi:hypothetical protein
MLDEVQEALVGPVEILDDEHERPLRRDRLEETAPGEERLGLAALAGGAIPCETDQGAQVGQDPLGVAALANRLRDRAPEFCFGVIGRVRLQNPGLRLDHFGQSPEAHAFAVGQATALAPVDELRIGFDRPEELVDEP